MNPSHKDNPLQLILGQLERVKRCRDGWIGSCPVSDHGRGRGDRNPSLSIGLGDDGQILLSCHVGCSLDAILGAIGLTCADLYPPADSSLAPRNRRSRITYDSIDSAILALLRDPKLRGGRVTQRYSYDRADGRLAFIVLRFDFNDGREKTFRPIHPVDDGWAVGDPPGKLPLYGLPELDGANCVYVCEGEKPVEAARSIGLCATTSAHGSQSAQNTDWTPLARKTVVIFCDNDAPGRKYAHMVARILVRLGCRVKILLLPGLPEGGDIVDFVEAHDSRESNEIHRMIEAIIAEAPLWRPAQVVDTPVNLRWRPFPVDVLPEPLRSFVTAGAKAIGCDESMIALPVLAVCAGVIGTTRVVQLKRGWTEPCVLWCVVVAESGTIKSPAQDYATRALVRLQGERFREYTDALKRYEAVKLQYDADLVHWRRKKNPDRGDPPTKPDPPVCQRYMVSDITVEASTPILVENCRGLLLVRDEVGGWLLGFNQYKGGRGSDLANWLEAHRAGTWIVDRKTGRQTIYVPRAAVSICGTIQPGTLQRILTPEYFDCGLVARLLLAAPPRREKRWSDAEVPVGVTERFVRMLKQLLTLQHGADDDGNPEPRLIMLSKEAQAIWNAWYNKFAQRQKQASGHYASALSKLEGYAARFAFVFHLINWAASPDREEGPIEPWAVENGIRLVEWFANETERLYEIFAETDEERETRKLIEFVEGKGSAVTVRDVLTGCRWIRTADEARGRLQRLVDAGLGRWERPRPGPKGGAPKELFYLSSHSQFCSTPHDGSASGDSADADAADSLEDNETGNVS